MPAPATCWRPTADDCIHIKVKIPQVLCITTCDMTEYSHFSNPRTLSRATEEVAKLPVECLGDWAPAIQEIESWPEYSRQPLHVLDKSAKSLGLNSIYYQDESQRFGKEMGSFKALGAPYTVACLLVAEVQRVTGRQPTTQQLRSGEFRHITKRVTVCVATDGSQGRGLAYGAKVFGCRCVDYIHGHVSAGRKEAMEALGAIVIRINGEYEASVKRAKEDARLNGWHFVSSTSWDDYREPIPRYVMGAYMVMVEEALSGIPDVGKISHVFMHGGVGSIAAAVFLGFYNAVTRSSNSKVPKFIVIEPSEADCLLQTAENGIPTPSAGSLHTIAAGLACREVSPAAWKILDWLASDFISIKDDWIIDGMKQLASGGGDVPIVCGESAAGAMGILVHSARDQSIKERLGLDETSQVVIFGCEGATDAVIYEELVGEAPSAVFHRQSSFLASK